MGQKGKIGTAMGVDYIRRPKCTHKWTNWKRTGVLDPTERRDCTKCKRIQTRKPRA